MINSVDCSLLATGNELHATLGKGGRDRGMCCILIVNFSGSIVRIIIIITKKGGAPESKVSKLTTYQLVTLQ